MGFAGGRRGGGVRTEAAVLLMGHLDVWAYVIQSQCAASNGPTIAGVLLRADRSAAKPPQQGPPWPRQPEPPGPEVCLSHSLHTPHTPDTPLSKSQLSQLKEIL